MSGRASWFALGAGALLLACAVGPRVTDLRVATQPEGVRANAVLHDNWEYRDAELLEVTDSTVLLLGSDRQLVRVHYTALRALLPRYGPALRRGASPAPDIVARWRALSRFPQGLPPAQLEALLAFHRQGSVQVRR